MCNFLRTPLPISTVAAHFTFPPTGPEGSNFSTSSPTLVIFRFCIKNNSHLNGCGVTPHCGSGVLAPSTGCAEDVSGAPGERRANGRDSGSGNVSWPRSPQSPASSTARLLLITQGLGCSHGQRGEMGLSTSVAKSARTLCGICRPGQMGHFLREPGNSLAQNWY